jgi:hypothetical protein
LCPREPSEFMSLSKSRIGRRPSISVSVVNWMVWWIHFRWCRKSFESVRTVCQKTMSSSTQRKERRGFREPIQVQCTHSSPFRNGYERGKRWAHGHIIRLSVELSIQGEEGSDEDMLEESQYVFSEVTS